MESIDSSSFILARRPLIVSSGDSLVVLFVGCEEGEEPLVRTFSPVGSQYKLTICKNKIRNKWNGLVYSLCRFKKKS